MVCEIENRIMRKVATAMIEAGYYIRVYDGEAYAGKTTRDVAEIMKQVGHTDETSYSVRKLSEGGEHKYEVVGNVYFVHGNGHDVVADYSAEGPVYPIMNNFFDMGDWR